MRELIGHECTIEFIGPEADWPMRVTAIISFTVMAVDMPMVKLRDNWGGEIAWVNTSTVKTIRTITTTPAQTKPCPRQG